MHGRFVVEKIHSRKSKGRLGERHHKEQPIRGIFIQGIGEGTLRQNDRKRQQPAKGKYGGGQQAAGHCFLDRLEPACRGQAGRKKHNDKIGRHRIKRHIAAETDKLRNENKDKRQQAAAQAADTRGDYEKEIGEGDRSRAKA